MFRTGHREMAGCTIQVIRKGHVAQFGAYAPPTSRQEPDVLVAYAPPTSRQEPDVLGAYAPPTSRQETDVLVAYTPPVSRQEPGEFRLI